MIILKTDKEIEIMRQGGKRLARILAAVVKAVKPGVTTAALERLACELIAKQGGAPAFKGYRADFNRKPFPTALCLSINDEIVHAPSLPTRILREGDLVGIDVGLRYPAREGLYTDMAVTVPVGKVSPDAARLIDVAKKSLKLAIKEVKPGNKLGDIGKKIEDNVLANGFSVVRDLVGHGVGHAIHEEPNVPNFAVDERWDEELKPGMTLAIEPMITAGGYEVASAADGFTIKTADGSLSAHFEHTVAVTKRGHRILTE